MRRLAVLAALLATAAYPHDFYSPTAAAIKTAFGDKIKLKEGNGKLPTPDSLKSRELKFINADKSVDHGETFETEGNVRLTIGGYEISGDRVTGNKKTHVFVAEGNAKVTGGDGEVTGSMVQVDLRNNTFRFLDGRAKLGPTYTQGRTTGDVFIWSTDGGGKRSDFLANKGGLTTCDLEHPHFLLDARSIRVEPGKKATLRSIRLEILGKTILTIPYLVVPLLNNGDRYIPEVGQGPDEGYFIKTKFSTPLHGENYIDTRLDYYTKLGAGLGLDYYYKNQSMMGKTSVYGLTGGTNTLLASAQHQQRLFGGDLTLDTNYQRNNYLTAPGTTLLNTRALWSIPWTSGNTRLTLYRMESEGNSYKSISQTIGISDSHRWSKTFDTRLDLNFARNESIPFIGDSTKNERLDLRFSTRQDFRSFQAELSYQRSIPIGETTGQFFNASDRTPYLTLRTDSRKIFGTKKGNDFPWQSEFSFGELTDPNGGGRITRIGFDLNFGQSNNSGMGSGLRWGGRFSQGIYSDDTAQFLVGLDAGYSWQFARNSTMNVNYRYLRPQGYTPLSIDRFGRNDAFSLDITYKPSKTLQFTAQTGYDLLMADQSEVPWQQLYLRGEWSPYKDLKVRAMANYDTFSTAWGTMRADVDWLSKDTRLVAGVRYDGRRSQWAGASLYLQGYKKGKITAGILWDYNGYTQQLESQHYSMTYDLHCVEAVLEVIDNSVGFRSGRQIGFYIRLKALPFSTPFGTGNRGEAIGSGSGSWGY